MENSVSNGPIKLMCIRDFLCSWSTSHIGDLTLAPHGKRVSMIRFLEVPSPLLVMPIFYNNICGRLLATRLVKMKVLLCSVLVRLVRARSHPS